MFCARDDYDFFLGGGRGVYEARRRGAYAIWSQQEGGGEGKTKPEMSLMSVGELD